MSSVEVIEESGAEVEELRELVRVVAIDDVIEHGNADSLELAIVGGWQCCVKIGEFKKGDLAFYCEIDALLPIDNPLFMFLEDRKESLRLIGDKVYSRVKTIRLRKELSQGILIPIPSSMKVTVGENFTAQFGVLKYTAKAEKQGAPVDFDLTWYGRMCQFIAGGPAPKLQLPWPSFLKKSDQPRIQNIAAQYRRAFESQEEFEATFKLDGASMTVWLNEQVDSVVRATGSEQPVASSVLVYGIGSRNNELIKDDIPWGFVEQFRRWFAALLMANRRIFRTQRFTLPRWKKGVIASEDMYVKAASELMMYGRLMEHYEKTGQVLAVQGELVGPGIQDNFEGLDQRAFYVYTVCVQEGPTYRELLPDEARDAAASLGLSYVPLLGKNTLLPPTTKECLSYAEGKAAFKKNGYREGVVFKSTTRNFSFKAISNSYLLKVSD